jgi:hypothetical protein
MPSREYYEGRDMEKNAILYKELIKIFNFDRINADGANRTKVDIFASKDKVKTFFSVKNATGKNTQIHLTSLKKMSSDLNVSSDITVLLEKWLGTNDEKIFKSWCSKIKISSYELSHKRIKSSNINFWDKIEDWINFVNKNKTLPNLLIEGLFSNEKPNYLIWVNKKEKSVEIINTKKLIDFISKKCVWLTMTRGTTMRCVTPENKPILWMQMKGNRTDDGYNHHPQFHIVSNWPKELVEHEFSI